MIHKVSFFVDLVVDGTFNFLPFKFVLSLTKVTK